eukprot:1586026-Alexandrium_andersonii.AAC.1
MSTGADTLLVAERHVDDKHCNTNRITLAHGAKDICKLKHDQLEHLGAWAQNRAHADGLANGDERLAALVTKDADVAAGQRR